jgi:hypothetical protein
MKTLEEIKQMAEEFTNENSGHYHYRGKESFIKGYTQCQEDMFDSLLANKLRSLYGNDDKKYTGLRLYVRFCFSQNLRIGSVITSRDYLAEC